VGARFAQSMEPTMTASTSPAHHLSCLMIRSTIAWKPPAGMPGKLPKDSLKALPVRERMTAG
jgi:hypothetical protein